MKFLCDAMLAHVGKRLRSAGYDTTIDRGQLADRELLEIANREDRYFLTCDREIKHHKASEHVVYLPSNDELVWAKYLTNELGVDWTYAPFTRCLECNTTLRQAGPEERLRAPENLRQEGKRALYCETCDKVYWDGSHVERMIRHLEHLKDL
jgi:uncharacterized protein